MKSESDKETIEETVGAREEADSTRERDAAKDGAVRLQRNQHVDPLDAAVLHDG